MGTIAENRELSGSAILAICGGSGGKGALDRSNPMGGSGGEGARTPSLWKVLSRAPQVDCCVAFRLRQDCHHEDGAETGDETQIPIRWCR